MKINFLTRPEYLFQPRAAIRRLLRKPPSSRAAYCSVLTPWKARIRFKNGEELGKSLQLMRVYDLAISEVLWRLTDPGEFACDIGANIGYTASILASRVGGTGKVICFEPHPEIFLDLENNVNSWQKRLGWKHVQCQPLALSDKQGIANLHVPEGFTDNRGIATISTSTPQHASGQEIDLSVQTDTLDNVLSAEKEVPKLVKIDVEGHELPVLIGASHSLPAIRDIIYEEHSPHPAETTLLLERQGYKVFRILKGFSRPIIVDPESQLVQKMSLYWEPANYLATRDPERALQRLEKKGWMCLRG